VKFVHEGENPTTYIPAKKRREIYDYMSKVSYTKHLESKDRRSRFANIKRILCRS